MPRGDESDQTLIYVDLSALDMSAEFETLTLSARRLDDRRVCRSAQAVPRAGRRRHAQAGARLLGTMTD